MVQSYRDLVAWNKAMELGNEIYRATQRLPKEEFFGLTSQIRRAALSIPSNIAEGKVGYPKANSGNSWEMPGVPWQNWKPRF